MVMGMIKATKSTKMRRHNARLGKVSRDAGGTVTMVQFNAYRDNPLAPTALVSKIGGIYRVDAHLIRVTFIDEIPNYDGEFEAIAQSHLVFKTEADWFAAKELLDFAMEQFHSRAQ